MSRITFEDVPQIIGNMNKKLDNLQALILNKLPENQQDYLMTVYELMEYLPEHPARQTIYMKVWQRKIPFEKHGKFLYFRKSVIDRWLGNGRMMM